MLIRLRNATYAPVRRTCGRYDACGGFTAGERVGNGVRIGRLRTSVRRAIISIYRASLAFRNCRQSSAIWRLAHDHRRRQSADRSPIASVSAGPAAADQGVASALESVLSDNTRRVYGAQWRIFTGWCDEVRPACPCPPSPSPWPPATWPPAPAPAPAVATIRLATSAISKAHEWAKTVSHPARTRGVRASLKGMGKTTLAKPQRQSGALTADVLAVIRLTAVQPRKRGRGYRDSGAGCQERGRFDVALVAVLSDAGLRRSEAASLTWGGVQRWDDGSSRITVIRSKSDVEAAGAVVAITPTAMESALRHPAGGGGRQ